MPNYTLSRFPPQLYKYINIFGFLKPEPEFDIEAPPLVPSIPAKQSPKRSLSITSLPLPLTTPIVPKTSIPILIPIPIPKAQDLQEHQLFIDQLSPDLPITCPLCYEIFSTIVRLGCCRHQVCEFCIQKWGKRTCAFCRAATTESVDKCTSKSESETMDWHNKRKIGISVETDGLLPAEVTPGTLQEAEDIGWLESQFMLDSLTVACLYPSCDFKGPRRMLRKHLESECSFTRGTRAP